MASFVKKTFFGLLTTGIVAMGCNKKNENLEAVPANNATGTTKTTYELLDSIFLYAKQLYLWNTQLPTYSAFQPRGYNESVSGEDIDKATGEIFALTRYAINPATGKSYELNTQSTDETKYSYIEEQDADLNNGSTGFKSNVTLLGIGNDLGVAYPVFISTDSMSGDSVFAFRLIYENGPAAKAGLTRGNCYVTAVNGKKFDYNNTTDRSMLENALNSSSISLTYFDTTGRTRNVTLNKTQYKSNPVFADTVFTNGSKKIGYMALLNFSDPNVLSDKLINAFSDFSSKDITDIIVDLRYNGGGYVASSEQLANLIAPVSLNGKTMFTENYNALMQAGNATILKQIPQEDDPKKTYYEYSWKPESLTYKFNSASGKNLSLKNVCFIVSDATASASELLINNLSPYMNVKLIGTTLSRATNNKPATTTTYGKPVGFFAIPIGKYDVYLSEFESRNSNNAAVSYSGMACDVTDWDDLTHNFGDRREDAIAQAISYITNGNFLTTANNIGSKSSLSKSNTNALQVLMSKKTGGTNSTTTFLKAFHNTQLPIQKGMVENFKTINRNK